MAQQYGRNITLTSDLSTIAYGFRPTYIRIDASTAGTAYLNFSTAIASTATTLSAFQLTSGASPIVIGNADVNGMSSQLTGIAATGSTAVIRVLAIRI